MTGVTAIRRGGRAERCRPYGLYNESRDGLIYNIRYTMPEEGELPEHYISMPRRPDSEGGFDGCVNIDGFNMLQPRTAEQAAPGRHLYAYGRDAVEGDL